MANQTINKIKQFLASLSFRTGVIVLCVCIACYIISFAVFALPIPLSTSSVLWFIFFGLAKTAQYSALLIMGKVGIERVKKFFRMKSQSSE